MVIINLCTNYCLHFKRIFPPFDKRLLPSAAVSFYKRPFLFIFDGQFIFHLNKSLIKFIIMLYTSILKHSYKLFILLLLLGSVNMIQANPGKKFGHFSILTGTEGINLNDLTPD